MGIKQQMNEAVKSAGEKVDETIGKIGETYATKQELSDLHDEMFDEVSAAKSGENMVTLNNISPIKHEIAVNVTIGKNLLYTPSREFARFENNENTWQRNFDYGKYYIMAYNNHQEYTEGTFVTKEFESFDETWKITSRSGYGVAFPVKVKPNTTYCLTYECYSEKEADVTAAFYDKKGNWLTYKALTINKDNDLRHAKINTIENCETLLLIFKDAENSGKNLI